MRERPERARRPQGNPAIGGFQAHYAAESGWNPDRASAVGSHAQRPHAQGHRRGASSARAAGGARKGPRVPRGSGEGTVRDALPSVLGRGRLPEKDGPVLSQPRRHRRVLVPFLVGIDCPRPPQRRPSPGQNEVLDGSRHPVEPPSGLPRSVTFFRPPSLGESLLRVDENKSVDAWVVQPDLVECRLGSLDRGKLPFAVQLQELRGGKKSDIAHARALPLARLALPNKRPPLAAKLALPRGCNCL